MKTTLEETTPRLLCADAGGFEVPCVSARRAPTVDLEVRHEAAVPGEEEALATRACLDRLAHLRDTLAALRDRAHGEASC